MLLHYPFHWQETLPMNLLTVSPKKNSNTMRLALDYENQMSQQRHSTKLESLIFDSGNTTRAVTAGNADTMARTAAGLLEGRSQVRNPKAKEGPDDHWHRGMLGCLDTTPLSMVIAAYEKAPKEIRDAFVHKLEENTARCNQPQGEERAIP